MNELLVIGICDNLINYKNILSDPQHKNLNSIVIGYDENKIKNENLYSFCWQFQRNDINKDLFLPTNKNYIERNNEIYIIGCYENVLYLDLLKFNTKYYQKNNSQKWETLKDTFDKYNLIAPDIVVSNSHPYDNDLDENDYMDYYKYLWNCIGNKPKK